MPLKLSDKFPLLLFLFLASYIIAQKSDTLLINKHLIAVTKTNGYRNFKDTNSLNVVAHYIYNELNLVADTVFFQEYTVDGRGYKNVIARINTRKNLPVIVVGAHYDVCGQQGGAADNASGVTGLLESARLLSGKGMEYEVEFVAFTLEEPPFFRTDFMGSAIHAQHLLETKRNVFGMVSLEMIGYFSDTENSQEYPLKFLSMFYGKTGNYITLVNSLNKGYFARKFTKAYAKNDFIRAKRISGPKSLTGIDFSDHMNYWNRDISALMLTDTAFYRNHNYHQETDTIDTIDKRRMAMAIDALVDTLLNFK